MFKFVRSCALFAVLTCLFTAAGAHAQNTARDRQLARVDFALTAPFELTRSTTGNGVSDTVSTAAGGMATLRYTKSPWIGAEMNYKRSRMTENYVYPFHGLGGTTTPTPLGVQVNVIEMSWGYVAHAPSTYYGFKPFGGVGLGSLEFKPTSAGGEGLLRQFRAEYYWNAGADYTFGGSHFGARAQIRQLFYLVPDFGQNYLTSHSRTSTIEPAIGFFARF